jgi:D-alanine-D-alanine ligase
MAPNSVPNLEQLEAACICVLYGGRSNEREVSLSSGTEILQSFAEARQQGLPGVPAKCIGVEIQADGTWLVAGESQAPGAALDLLSHVDLFFLGLHGTDGEDGIIQGLFSVYGRRFTGSGVAGSAVSMDKEFTRRVVASAGVKVANGIQFSREQWGSARLACLQSITDMQAKAWVIKPRSEGSSVGVSVLREFSAITKAVDSALSLGEFVLIEECIDGVEVAAGVLQHPDGKLQALPIVEICPKPGRFFDYEEKYSQTGAKEHCPPLNVSKTICSQLKELALIAHRELRCQGYSRSDFIVPRDGSPVFLETNTLPGMTPRSLLPQAAQASGLSYHELCALIALEGLSRRT